MVSVIEPSPHRPASAYVAATGYKSDDLRPYLYRTDDFGATWTNITEGIADDEFTRVIRADPARPGLLYCGTERGINVSFDDGATWQRLETNLPVTPILDLVVKDTDLVAATHGRSFWILDDVTPLHQLQASPAEGAAMVFKPRDTVRYKVYGRALGSSKTHLNYKMTGPLTVAFRRAETPSGAVIEQFADAGRNPPDGVIVQYWLPDPKPESVKLAILDSDGHEVRSFGVKPDKDPGAGPWAPNEPGMNRLVWDYRYAAPTKLDQKSPSAGDDDDDGDHGPRAVPGAYQVQLTAGAQTCVQDFSLLPDPRLTVSAADLDAQFQLLLGIRDRLSETHTLVNQIRRLYTQIDAWQERAPADDDQVKTAAQALKDQLKVVEGELINVDADKPQPGPNRLKEKWAALGSMIDESDDAPTRGAQEVYEQLRGHLAAQQHAFSNIVEGPVNAFNALVVSVGIPALRP
jgi:hypothetical protein